MLFVKMIKRFVGNGWQATPLAAFVKRHLFQHPVDKHFIELCLEKRCLESVECE